MDEKKRKKGTKLLTLFCQETIHDPCIIWWNAGWIIAKNNGYRCKREQRSKEKECTRKQRSCIQQWNGCRISHRLICVDGDANVLYDAVRHWRKKNIYCFPRPTLLPSTAHHTTMPATFYRHLVLQRYRVSYHVAMSESDYNSARASFHCKTAMFLNVKMKVVVTQSPDKGSLWVAQGVLVLRLMTGVSPTRSPANHISSIRGVFEPDHLLMPGKCSPGDDVRLR